MPPFTGLSVLNLFRDGKEERGRIRGGERVQRTELTKGDAAGPWNPSPLSVGVMEGIGDFVLRFLNRGILCRLSHCNLHRGKSAVLCPWDCSASST